MYTEIPYINSSPVPACHGFVLVVPACLVFTEKRAGQPVLVSSSAVQPRKEMLFSQKCSIRSSCARTVTSDPDLEAEARFSPRPNLDGSFPGEGVCSVEGGSGSLPRLP